jgi:hypothetical protein
MDFLRLDNRLRPLSNAQIAQNRLQRHDASFHPSLVLRPSSHEGNKGATAMIFVTMLVYPIDSVKRFAAVHIGNTELERWLKTALKGQGTRDKGQKTTEVKEDAD